MSAPSIRPSEPLQDREKKYRFTEMEYYRIRSHPYVFHAQVQTSRNRPTKIKVGGKIGCLDITVYGDDDCNPYLEGLYSNPDCAALNEDAPMRGMLPSTGTAKLLKAALSFMYRLYPRQGDIQFFDTSHINCAKGKRLNVYDLYIVKHLKTWYQDKVNATPINPLHEERLQHLYAMLKMPYKEANFEEFSSRFLHGIVAQPELTHLKRILRPIYENNTSYHDFLKQVSENDCEIFDKWLSNFINSHVHLQLHSIMWCIKKSNVSTFPEIEVTRMAEEPLFIKNKKVMDQSYLFQFGGDRHQNGGFEQFML